MVNKRPDKFASHLQGYAWIITIFNCFWSRLWVLALKSVISIQFQ